MKLGGIELGGGTFGGYEIVNKPATSLPQDLATAFSEVNGGILGATYMPIWYVGTQLVNGVNHMLICKEIRTTRTQNQMIVAMVINIPPAGSDKGPQIVEIIEEAKLAPELQAYFDTAVKGLCGVNYKPVAYIGSQVVRGTNYYFACEATRVYPGSKPYAVTLGINVFNDQVSIISIDPMMEADDNEGGVRLGTPLGEWP